ncbi:hypothetical protein V6C03_09695 [Methyloligella sp. 2.7D]|uniref:hypothetical protein n=1 Tax=unclassified Methyloligella TaxID=2625955 RepID=UPI00157E2262|nr:hypothetical protein [Methyloligella sp. GL2]QKP77881.1 hypothetical protein HT051_10760 [Methyloligella sp. GL2]
MGQKLSLTEFSLIESALQDSPRGRWFLAEFARRNRSADTEVLLRAIARLEAAMIRAGGGGRVGLQPKKPAAARKPSASKPATQPAPSASLAPVAAQVERVAAELEALTASGAKATEQILLAAETLQDVAWEMRDGAPDTRYCERIETGVRDIFGACTAQEAILRKRHRAVSVLQEIRAHLIAMAEGRVVKPMASPTASPASSPAPERRAETPPPAETSPAAAPATPQAAGHETAPPEPSAAVGEAALPGLPEMPEIAPEAKHDGGIEQPPTAASNEPEKAPAATATQALQKLHAAKRAAMFG